MHILTKEYAISILAQYIELKGKLEEFSLMPQGMFNENARLVVAGSTFVLKKMTTGRSKQRNIYGAMLQKTLADGGFPCPGIISNQHGELVTEHEGNLWSLQTWADGGNCPAQLRDGPEATAVRAAVGAALGRLHAMGLQAQEQGKLPPAPEDTRLPMSSIISRSEASYNYIFSGSFLRPSQATRLKFKPGKSAFLKEVVAILPVLKKGCHEVAAWDPGQHESLAVTGPCHGDINWENLFFKEGKLTAVLDFDNAMQMSPAFDAAAAAAVICADNAEHLEAFLAAYHQAGGVTIDPSALRPMMLLKFVKSLCFQVGVVIAGGSRNDEFARGWVKFLAENINLLVDDSQ